MNKAKTKSKFRVAWENDIPICLEVQSDYQWQELPWKQIEKRVHKLQKRIYQASKRGDVKVVRKLQKTLIRSWSAKCLAVRRVTQDNQGKKTAGIDGIKSLKPNARLELINKLKITGLSKPTRRVWIPKPGTEEKRPLGIPTMHDRALQALTKLTLEPEWEARFEGNSYGFRPGRSCHDAIEAIFNAIRQKAKYVLDADIAKCFDKINHEALLAKINTFPKLQKQIKSWLNSGVVDGKNLFPTNEGTPQGGVISPLLANIALHGMEIKLMEFAKTLDIRNPKGNQVSWQTKVKSLSIIRYADDFVVIHEDQNVVIQCQEIISEWLKGMGLELKPSKTKITHTLHEYNGNVGFNFLGFHIQQYPSGNYRSASNSEGKRLGFNTLITPSKEKQKVHQRNLAGIVDKNLTKPQAVLITELNSIIRGWSNYYSTVSSQKVLDRMDFLLYQKLRAWAKRRNTHSNKYQISDKYWHTVGNDDWCFSTRQGLTLEKHSKTPIKVFTKVQGIRSPYDGDWIYWSTRMGRNPEVSTKLATLLKRQQGKCNHCGLPFKPGDLIEIDHIEPKSKGGKNSYANLQALHKHCHDTKTTTDGSLGTRDIEPFH